MEMDQLDLDQIDTTIQLSQPESDTTYDDYSNMGKNYSLYMNRGCRRSQQDRYFIEENEDSQIYAVFDGHGEDSISSEFIANHLHKNIVHHLNGNPASESILLMKQELLLRLGRSYTITQSAEMIQEQLPQITIASLGDSQAIVVKKAGQFELLGTIHSLQNQIERQRIKQIGGIILQVGNTLRLMGKLSVSKAFGNNSIKQFLSCEPDIYVYKRTPEDIGLVIATDGLWNLISAQDVARLMVENQNQDQENISKKIYQTAEVQSKHYVPDNVTVMTVKFNH